MHEEIWGSAKHLQSFISGRFGKIFILSKKKKKVGGRSKQEKTLEISHFEENGDALSLNGRKVLPACDMNRVQTSNLCL